ncbi:type 2 DNA topoisomerase 6 subunit B-like [Rhynchocyon petersi]
MVHPKIKCNFSVKVNGTLSEENFGVENEPILNLPNGIALVANCQRYVSQPELGATELLCSRIHSVPVQPVTLSIPDDVASMGLPSQLILTPAAALCPCSKQMYVFLYGPSALPLILTSRAQPTAIFTDIARLIDWKKHHLCVVPNLDFSLVGDSVLPDVSFQIESCAGALSQSADVQGQTLLLFFFLDFHSGFPVHHMELCGVHALLTTHFHAILLENQQVIQDSIQTAVDQALEQCHQAAKTHQKLRVAQAVAVNSIMSVVLGSTSSSFRRMCFQALQAADSKEFGTKLHKAFNRISQHRFLHHCSCEVKQSPADKQSARDKRRTRRPGPSAVLWLPQAARCPRVPPRGRLGRSKGMHWAWRYRGDVAGRAGEALAPPGPYTRRGPFPPQDALWLQEVANLSEWLSASP